jgi:hypothetical protein
VNRTIESLKKKAIRQKGLGRIDAHELWELGSQNVSALFGAASEIRSTSKER